MKAWFENGSEVRRNIEREAAVPLEFRVFRWAGRNSFRARSAASRALGNHLETAFRERPNSKHVILAHSHGGTVAADCIAGISSFIPGIPRIKALVCMATPFVYTSSPSSEHRDAFAWAIGSVLMGGLLAALLLWWPGLLVFNSLWILGAGFLAIFLISFGFLSSPIFPNEPKRIHEAIQVFIVRATRDEATLVLGLAQAIRYLLGWVYEMLEELSITKLRLRHVMIAIPFHALSVAGAGTLLWLVWSQVQHEISTWQILVLIILLSQALDGSLLVAAGFALAVAVGFLECAGVAEQRHRNRRGPAGERMLHEVLFQSELPACHHHKARHL